MLETARESMTIAFEIKIKSFTPSKQRTTTLIDDREIEGDSSFMIAGSSQAI